MFMHGVPGSNDTAQPKRHQMCRYHSVWAVCARECPHVCHEPITWMAARGAGAGTLPGPRPPGVVCTRVMRVWRANQSSGHCMKRPDTPNAERLSCFVIMDCKNQDRHVKKKNRAREGNQSGCLVFHGR